MNTLEITPKLKKNIKQWIDALRSGKYNQTIGSLQNKKGYCCLGVACKVFIPDNKQNIKNNYLVGKIPIKYNQPSTPNWLEEINHDVNNHLINLEHPGIDLIYLNDIKKLNFDEIADCLQIIYIEKPF